MSDEQRVRTMAGWIGVEISRSRVRTPGKRGYGLYRVRGQRNTAQGWIKTGWTDYVLGLGAIEGAVRAAIRHGAPSGPASLITGAGVVATRWTSAYRGRRDLGLMGQDAPGIEVPPGGDSLGERPHDGERCHAQGRPHLGPCWSARAVDAVLRPSTVRSRQRAANAEFQKAHKRRRDHGLKVRYALKAARKTQPGRTQE